MLTTRLEVIIHRKISKIQLPKLTNSKTCYYFWEHARLAIHPGFVYEPIVLKPLFQLIDGYGFLEAESLRKELHTSWFSFFQTNSLLSYNNDQSFTTTFASRWIIGLSANSSSLVSLFKSFYIIEKLSITSIYKN